MRLNEKFLKRNCIVIILRIVTLRNKVNSYDYEYSSMLFNIMECYFAGIVHDNNGKPPYGKIKKGMLSM